MMEVVWQDIKDFSNNPSAKVMEDPRKALIYSVALKVLTLYVAIISTCLSAGLFTAALIVDFFIVINFNNFVPRLAEQMRLPELNGLYEAIITRMTSV